MDAKIQRMKSFGASMLLGIALQWTVASAHADSSASNKRELEMAWKAAQAAAIVGPADIPLRDQAKLKIGNGEVFIPKAQADRLMKANGNSEDPDRIGLVVPTNDDEWIVDVDYIASGYIRDDEARDWNVDDLYKSLKEGTEAANADREERGIAPVEIIGWVERPHYDAAKRHLIWSMASRSKDEPAGAPQTINYNTYALGREGYISLDLITDKTTIDKDKRGVQALLAGLDFNSGKRYADFDAKTDKLAEYGLAALIGGVAMKKLGLFALIAAFAAKFFKVIALAVVALGGGLVKWFKRKPTPDSHTTPDA
jgi:uncharacterized membrane-anchored protein